MTQRPDQFTLNGSHPLATGLVFFGGGAMAGSSLYKDSSLYGNDGTLASSLEWDGTSVQMSTTSTSDYITLAKPAITSANTYTASAWVDYQVNGGNYNFLAVVPCEIHNKNALFSIRENGYIYIADNSYSLSSLNSAISGKHHYAVVRRAAAAYCEVYRDGKFIGNTTSALGTFTTSSMTYIGKWNSVANATPIVVGQVCVHSRDLSLPEIQQLANPSDPMLGGLILPPTRKWFPVSGGAAGGTTIDCTTGAVVIAGQNATVSAGTTISCTTGAVTVAGVNATVSAGTTIACTTGAVVIAGLGASISAGGEINCSLGAIAITGLASNVSAGTTIACTTGTVAIASTAATVSAGSTVTCTLGAIVIAALDATVTSTSDTEITCTLGAVVIQGYNSSVTNSAATPHERNTWETGASGRTWNPSASGRTWNPKDDIF